MERQTSQVERCEQLRCQQWTDDDNEIVKLFNKKYYCLFHSKLF